MKYLFILKLFMISLLLTLTISMANGQTTGNAANTQENQVDPQTRAEVFRELGLSRDQLQQIRQINKERRPIMQESKARLDDANAALDKAIYNKASEAEIQARLKDVQAAHAEVIKNRTLSEAAISKVLTPEQLSRFRAYQQKYNEQKRAERIQNRQNERKLNQEQKQNQFKNNAQNPNKVKNNQPNTLPRRRKRVLN